MNRPHDLDPIELNLDEEAPPGESGSAAKPEAGEAPAPAEGAAPSPENLAAEVARLQAQMEELRASLVRRQADFENFRKRVERERRHDADRATAALIDRLLPILDAFERALAAHDDPAYEEYRKGFELIYRQLGEALARHGLERIEALGKPFDPHFHHAVERVETEEQDEDTVVAELQAGYRLRDKVLRPAMVRVAVRPAAKVN